MALANTHEFTETVIHWDKFAEWTKNRYKVVSSRPYSDRNGVLPDGYTLELKVIEDHHVYAPKKDGTERENNVDQNFQATVLSRGEAIHKGDYISLGQFDAEHSYAIGFDLILRFKDYKKLQKKEA